MSYPSKEYPIFTLEQQKEMFVVSRQSPEKAKEIYNLWLNSLMPLIFKTSQMDDDTIQFCCLHVWSNMPNFNPERARLITYFYPLILGARNVVLNHNSIRNQKEFLKMESLPDGADVEKKKVDFDAGLILAESLVKIKGEVPNREYDIWYRRKIGEHMKTIGITYKICRERVRQIEQKVDVWINLVFRDEKYVPYVEFSTNYERKRYLGVL